MVFKYLKVSLIICILITLGFSEKNQEWKLQSIPLKQPLIEYFKYFNENNSIQNKYLQNEEFYFEESHRETLVKSSGGLIEDCQEAFAKVIGYYQSHFSGVEILEWKFGGENFDNFLCQINNSEVAVQIDVKFLLEHRELLESEKLKTKGLPNEESKDVENTKKFLRLRQKKTLNSIGLKRCRNCFEQKKFLLINPFVAIFHFELSYGEWVYDNLAWFVRGRMKVKDAWVPGLGLGTRIGLDWFYTDLGVTGYYFEHITKPIKVNYDMEAKSEDDLYTWDREDEYYTPNPVLVSGVIKIGLHYRTIINEKLWGAYFELGAEIPLYGETEEPKDSDWDDFKVIGHGALMGLGLEYGF